MSGKNIKYKSKQILEFYSANRQRWEQFYLSERWAFEKIAGRKKSLGTVLDVGCACGGLASALSERFILSSYTGIDIHKGAIEWARKERRPGIPLTFIAGDIVKQTQGLHYDVVVSLSCADWNIETCPIIEACWKKVKRGGYFVISLRLTPEEGVNNIKKSYQYINFSGDEKKPERANYAVFNFRKALRMLQGLFPSPKSIAAYGYWGRPSATAVTPFERLIFAVFAIEKELKGPHKNISTEFNLPTDILL